MYPLDVPQKPVSFDVTPSAIADETERLLQQTSNLWDTICSSVTSDNATFENTVFPIARDENVTLESARVIQFHPSVNPDPDIRDAARAASTKMSEAEVELYSRTDMFSLVDAVYTREQQKNGDNSEIDQEDLHYLYKLRKKFMRNGCNIKAPKFKEEFLSKSKRIKAITTQMRKNFYDESAGIWAAEEELQGVPARLISRYKKGTDEREGQHWISTKVPFSNPILENAASEQTRKRMFYAVKNRIPENIPLHRELILLRDETARLLGYPNYFVLNAEDKMAKTPSDIRTALDKIRKGIEPMTAENTRTIKQLKMESLKAQGLSTENIRAFLWDDTYYDKKRDEDERPGSGKVAEYFELQHTLQEMLVMFGEMFDTRFQKVSIEEQSSLGNGRSLIWHEDVQMYVVWDTRGEEEAFLGYAYLDLHPRDGKYTHAGHYALQYGYETGEGKRFYPSSALVLNLAGPTETHPALLSLENIRQLFHELGHLHHGLCTKVRHASLSRTDRDFVETPSLMFEEFLWLPHSIERLAFHYSHISPDFKEQWLRNRADEAEQQPPPQLPTADVASVTKVDTLRRVRSQRSNVFFSLYDILVHSPDSHTELEKMNLCHEFNKLHAEIRGLSGGEACGDGWEWSHGEAVFRAICGDYGASYYGYVLSRVQAVDMFVTCFKGDVNNKEAARRFRDQVLEVGGRQPESKTFEDFVGRPPSIEPYLEWLGLA